MENINITEDEGFVSGQADVKDDLDTDFTFFVNFWFRNISNIDSDDGYASDVSDDSNEEEVEIEESN